jgi:Ca2+-binding EF-hand superfamily protein
MLRGVVQRETLPSVLKAIDDTLHARGLLKNNRARLRAMAGQEGGTTDAALASASGPLGQSAPRKRAELFQGEAWNFEKFWGTFARVVMAHDILPFSALQEGAKEHEKEIKERQEREEAHQKEVEKRLKKEAEGQANMEIYAGMYDKLMADEAINDILKEGKMLTGDDVRPGDAGYEYEVPPKGSHVSLLADFLVLLGFKDLQRDGSKQQEERWWTAELAGAWTILQEMHHAEIADGVVERDILQKVLVAPLGFTALTRKIEDELERRAEGGGGGVVRHGSIFRSEAEGFVVAGAAAGEGKPSMEVLCQRLGMPMARLEWLHGLFESYLNGEGAEQLKKDNYPDDPSSINKDQMRELFKEMNPDLSEPEFEARFMRIDEDGSGLIEFDEFVAWVHEDEVQVIGVAGMEKRSLEDLADFYSEPLELVTYLHTCWKDQLPEGEEEDYPLKPASLAKQDIRSLIKLLTPEVSDEDFEAQFELVDVDQKERLEFDEFLEVLCWDDLDEDTRKKYDYAEDPTSPQ